jgi:hypothetical protein
MKCLKRKFESFYYIFSIIWKKVKPHDWEISKIQPLYFFKNY